MEVADKVNPNYRKAIEQINIDGEEQANENMKPVYAEQKNSLDEMHKLIGLLFIKYSVDGNLNLNKVQKIKVLANISNQLNKIKKDLGDKEVNAVTYILKNEYKNVYFKNAYVIDSGIKANLKFNIPKQEYIDAAVNAELDGELFRDRIWKNKADLVTTLKQSLIEIMRGNTTIDKAGKLIENTFNASAYKSYRLMITELTRVQSQAQTDIATNIGLKKQMWSATLDTKTCEECAALDGKIFDIDDESRPEMPLHPNDRCCWINVPFDGWQPTKRKDNESKNIIDYQDYNSWLNDNKIVDDMALEEKLGKDTDSNVDWDVVNSKEYDDKFNNIGNSEAVDNSIYRTAMRILNHRNGTKFEDLYILDLSTGKTITYTTQNTEMGIQRTAKLEEILSKKNGDYVIIHNHPHSSTFSVSDLKTLFNSKSVNKMMAIGHDGSVYVINSKNIDIDIENEYNMRYTKLKKYGFSDATAKEKALQSISDLFGLGYERR